MVPISDQRRRPPGLFLHFPLQGPVLPKGALAAFHPAQTGPRGGSCPRPGSGCATPKRESTARFLSCPNWSVLRFRFEGPAAAALLQEDKAQPACPPPPPSFTTLSASAALPHSPLLKRLTVVPTQVVEEGARGLPLHVRPPLHTEVFHIVPRTAARQPLCAHARTHCATSGSRQRTCA